MRTAFTASLFTLAATPAFAHLDPVENGSFMAGFSHPLFGLDHILAMVAVGLWAAMTGGRAVWIVPAAFVATMVLGFGAAMAGVPLPFVEPAILASVVALGILVALAVDLPVLAGAAIVALFALFHGHAHGEEIGMATALPYLLGFAAVTTLLHLAGMAFGLTLGSGVAIGKDAGAKLARGTGAACAAVGIGLFMGAV